MAQFLDERVEFGHGDAANHVSGACAVAWMQCEPVLDVGGSVPRVGLLADEGEIGCGCD